MHGQCMALSHAWALRSMAYPCAWALPNSAPCPTEKKYCREFHAHGVPCPCTSHALAMHWPCMPMRMLTELLDCDNLAHNIMPMRRPCITHALPMPCPCINNASHRLVHFLGGSAHAGGVGSNPCLCPCPSPCIHTHALPMHDPCIHFR